MFKRKAEVYDLLLKSLLEDYIKKVFYNSLKKTFAG